MTASKLIKPSIDYKESYLEALAEYQAEGIDKHLNLKTLRHEFDKFIDDRLHSRSHSFDSFPDWVEIVPETELWLVKNEEYIGTVEIRHRLNWHLEKWGGHISFIIRPSKRGIGYGRKLLNKAIPYAEALGIENALLTIKPDNDIAISIIEKCGGVFEGEHAGTERFPPHKSYWLNCRK
jgi:predicted acetyltransferase